MTCALRAYLLERFVDSISSSVRHKECFSLGNHFGRIFIDLQCNEICRMLTHMSAECNMKLCMRYSCGHWFNKVMLISFLFQNFKRTASYRNWWTVQNRKGIFSKYTFLMNTEKDLWRNLITRQSFPPIDSHSGKFFFSFFVLLNRNEDILINVEQ